MSFTKEIEMVVGGINRKEYFYLYDRLQRFNETCGDSTFSMTEAYVMTPDTDPSRMDVRFRFYTLLISPSQRLRLAETVWEMVEAKFQEKIKSDT